MNEKEKNHPDKKKDIQKEKIVGVFFLLFLLLFLVLEILLPKQEISKTERRHFATFPKLSMESLQNGDFSAELENYLLDHFPGRDMFRTLQAEVETGVFGKKDTNGYFKIEDGIYKQESEWNEQNVTRAALQFDKIMETYFPDGAGYYAIIPDKNSYLAEENAYFALPFEKIEEIMNKNFSHATELKLKEHLELTDYYRTDFHWKQEGIGEAADYLLKAMDEDWTEQFQEIERESKLATAQFFGGYAGASALKVTPDELFYYTDDKIEAMQVYDYEKKSYVSVYAEEKLGETDDYDFYLWGARALMTIENTACQNGKNLLLFRDSFGSSIAPLLAENYEKVTLVDLRYVSLRYAMELLAEEQYDDVLFLYHVSLLNNSDSMRFS